MERGLRGDRREAEVNQTLTRIDGCPAIVSQFVANRLVERFGEALLTAARAMGRGTFAAHSHPTMDDVLAGMEFVHRSGRSAHGQPSAFRLVPEEGAEPSPLLFSGDKAIHFRLSTFASASFAVDEGDWFVPQVRHRGGFDCVQYWAGRLIFVEVVRSETHSLALQWHERFRAAFAEKFPDLAIAACEVWFVVSAEALDSFRPAAPCGTLTGCEPGSCRVVGMEQA